MQIDLFCLKRPILFYVNIIASLLLLTFDVENDILTVLSIQ